MRRTVSTAAAAFAGLAGAPALAAEGGMPQLNFHDFPPQLVWLAITFIILYVVMAKVALPRVGGVLQMRADRIKDDLDRAAALKEQTDRTIAAYEKARADARNQAVAVGRQTAAGLAQKAAERQAKVGAELTAKIKAAEANIAAARDRAMGEIRTVAADIAADAAKRLVGLQVPPAEAQAAVAAALKERG
ncbi:MAG TPA: F0F1 ATP synthase subunit B' [Stellaceae bacterium]